MMMDAGPHKIEYVDISDLKPNPRNPNVHSEEQIERLAKIIKYQGWRLPIIVSRRSGYIVAGHGRLMAAHKLGLKEVPVSYQDFLSEDQEKAFLVSDNAIAAWAELDFSIINLELESFDPQFDLELLGLQDFDLDPAEKKIEEEKIKEDDDSVMCPSCGACFLASANKAQ